MALPSLWLQSVKGTSKIEGWKHKKVGVFSSLSNLSLLHYCSSCLVALNCFPWLHSSASSENAIFFKALPNISFHSTDFPKDIVCHGIRYRDGKRTATQRKGRY
jgi:hypothetical protein